MLFFLSRPEFRDGSYALPQQPSPKLFFYVNPLILLTTWLSSKSVFFGTYFIAIGVVILTMVLGRVFCGWVCPLGTLQDYAQVLWSTPPQRRRQFPRVSFKYYLLIALLFLSLLGMNLVGIVDPLSVTFRSLTLGVLPPVSYWVERLLTVLQGLPVIGGLSYGAYNVWRENILGGHSPFYLQGWFYLLLFGGILSLVAIQRRFWCRYLCPLGALLGVCAMASPFRRHLLGVCNHCHLCQGNCRMQAIGEDEKLESKSECILCLDCQELCRQEAVVFSFRRDVGESQPAGLELSRRGVLLSLTSGLLVLPLVRLNRFSEGWTGALRDYLRPPGVTTERKFLQLCQRCGECMKVCPTSALQPAMLQAGLEGLWTPLVVPRIGNCEYNCNLCGLICPTGAIPPLSLPVKQKQKLGLAVINQHTCLPWATNTPCFVCEEACPLSPKAIELRGGGRQQRRRGGGRGGRVIEEEEAQGGPARPYVDELLCIGCGSCENSCPIVGSAITVIATM